MQELNFHNEKGIRKDIVKSMMLKALERKPNSIKFLLHLAWTNAQLEKFDDLNTNIQKILNHPKCTDYELGEVGVLLSFIHDYERSLFYLKQISDIHEMPVKVQFAKLEILFVQNKNEPFRELSKAILKKYPLHVDTLCLVAKAYFHSKKFEQAFQTCQKILEIDIHHVETYSVLLDVLEQSSRHQLSKLNDFQKLIHPFKISDDDISSSVQNFNTLLSQYIDARKDWLDQPLRYATNNGQQVNDLLDLQGGQNDLMDQFKNLLKDKIKSYLEIVAFSGLDYFNSPPDNLSFFIWGVKLQSGGFQAEHIHPFGWISGVYYIDLPSFNAETNEGALEFGVRDITKRFHSKHIIHPEKGKLVLFPSYLRHRTIPFTTEGERICLSFDVVPMKG